MAELENVSVSIFDPVTPFKKIVTTNIGVDTWFRSVVITKDLREKLPYVPEIGKRSLSVSSGMAVKLPVIEVGIQIGSILIPETEALVADNGEHDIVLGSCFFNDIFKLDKANEQPSSSAEEQASSEELSVELYPVTHPLNLVYLENFIK